MTYQVIFIQGNYRHIDYETKDFNQAELAIYELTQQMYNCGERNFTYIIETKEERTKENEN